MTTPLLSIGISFWVEDVVLGAGSVLSFGFLAVLIIGLIRRLLRDRVGKEKSVSALAIDEYSTSYYIEGRRGRTVKQDCVLVFDVSGRTVKFLVSPIVYDCVEKGQKGILVFRGSKYIDFGETERKTIKKKRFCYYRKKD